MLEKSAIWLAKIVESTASVKLQLAVLTTFLLWYGKVDQYVWAGIIVSLTGMREYSGLAFAKMGMQGGKSGTDS